MLYLNITIAYKLYKLFKNESTCNDSGSASLNFTMHACPTPAAMQKVNFIIIYVKP